MSIFGVSTEPNKRNLLVALAPILLLLVFVWFTNPFLKLPYDPWEHLIKIRSIFDTGDCFLYWPENLSTFCSWHRSWALVFTWLGIDHALTWADLIHRSQFIFSIVCVFYFCITVCRLAAKHAPYEQILLAASFAVLFWLVGNGTYSVAYQQAWVMWYSVTYQGVTIPIFWLITALMLQIFFDENLSLTKKWVFPFLIMAGGSIGFVFHPSETVYFFIFFSLSLAISPLLSLKRKLIAVLLLVLLIPCALYVIDSFYHLPFTRLLRSWPEVLSLAERIERDGNYIVTSGLNRANNSFSELAIFSSIAAFVYWLVALIRAKDGSIYIVTLVLLAIILFYLIPTNKWLAGTTGIILHKHIVWRFFFASPWFVIFPLIALKSTNLTRYPKLFSSIFLILVLSGSFYISKNHLHQAMAGNVESLWNSVDRQKIGPQYSPQQLEQLEQELNQRTKGHDKKKFLLYVRGDLGTVARALYGYYVYSHRRVFIPMARFYGERLEKKYYLLPIDTPPGFTKDPLVFSVFNLDTRSISKRSTLTLEGSSKVVFHLKSTDVGKRYIYLTGWAFLEAEKGEPKIYTVLVSENDTILYDASELFRWEIGRKYQKKDLLSPGFVATIPIRNLAPGTYQVGIMVVQGNGKGHVLTNRTVTVPRKERTRSGK